MVLSLFSGVANADQYDEQIKVLKQQAAQQQAVANQFSAQAADYRSKVAQLNGQINVLQAQINLSTAQYNQVSANIAANEIKLNEQKASLGANLKSMYLSSGITPLEMIVSSNNLSDYFDQQQYQDTIKNKIQGAMSSILELQKQLESQQKQAKALLATQQLQQAQVVASRSEVAQLLAIASQNEAAATTQVRNSNAQAAALHAEQQAVNAAKLRASGGGGITASASCGGGYPDKWCRAPIDSLVDSWGMYNRECVSYTAYKVYASGRNMPYWGGRGNAKQWPGNARAAGIPVNSTAKVGAIAVTYAGPYGHVMYVESVSGERMTVSQYNYAVDGNYSVMNVPISYADEFIHFP